MIEMEIPERLVLVPDAWEVRNIFETPVTITDKEHNLPYQRIENVALIMPKEYGQGSITNKFTMMVVRIKDGELSANGADSIVLTDYGKLGFSASGGGFRGILLDNEETYREYVEMGYGSKIENLSDVVRNLNPMISSSEATRDELTYAAAHIAPYLAEFFNLSPEVR